MNIERIVSADALVIGAGLAGLRAAWALANAGVRTAVVDRGEPMASPEVMGFNAAVHAEDSAACYRDDIMRSGHSLGNPTVARALAEGAAREIPLMESLGVRFDRTPTGELDTLFTLGCTWPRLVHEGAVTGGAIVRLLRQRCAAMGVQFFEPAVALDVLCEENRVTGVVCADPKRNALWLARCPCVVLAAGGGSGLFERSTYPIGTSGDGYAMAFRAGAEMVDMEFQQYEPCCFVTPDALRGKLVPTTLLRAGAEMQNALGHAFMRDYGLTVDNAQKGALARAIAAEVRAGRGTPAGGVYYDVSMLPRDLVVRAHSIFYEPAKRAGLDLMREPAQVYPAAHTSLGGARIGPDGSTTVSGLFAAGEVTGGVHGANRIGGCAGAETLVFGGLAGASAARYAQTARHSPETALRAQAEALVRGKMDRGSAETDLPALRAHIRQILSRHAGIVKRGAALAQALMLLDAAETQALRARVEDVDGLLRLYACENALLAARLHITASLRRQESRGVFYREDFPEINEQAWRANIVIWQANGKMLDAVRPVREGGEEP